MSKKISDLLKHCRYYKGESEPPKALKEDGTHFIWLVEELWVKHQMEDKEPRLYCGRGYLKPNKLPSSFYTLADIPGSLLVLLYDRYCYHNAFPVNLDTPEDVYGKGIQEFYENFISVYYPPL